MGFSPTSTFVCALSVLGFLPGLSAQDNLDTDTPPTDSAEPGRDHAAYARALEALDEAMLVANTDPEQGIALLNRALSALHQFAPLLAVDQTARMRRSLAHLALARAKLSRGDERGAAESIDQTLRELGDLELPSEQLGPTLGRLVDERRAALTSAGDGHLRVVCAAPCSVWVDERDANSALATEGLSLVLGSHRVWIEDQAGRLEPLHTRVELDDVGQPLELHYPPPITPRPELVHEPSAASVDQPIPRRVRRLAPRWAEISTASVGVAALTVGAVLWAINDTCPGGSDPRDTQACPQLYDTRASGISTVVLGSAILVTGVVMLTFDEVRQRRHGREHARAHSGLPGLHF